LRGYAANDLSIFRLVWSYLVVTQDKEFLSEKIADQTVLQRIARSGDQLEETATKS